ncbi:hypothetical protein [Marixanthomonas spongiae]|uniref:Uncharacterized protein n=1 Tax=Marixanthomonas spongiae TaxID=2174845 RepID=A0A2U0HYT7_9FLAO|nr:hypothetical protein [Marixanthomonas spongiae]PVW13910.1 hypothetical protein DDV96_12225 [Marixanthomonas spongiae]
MELEIDIKIYLKSAFESGFKIVESKDLGMAKFCRLEYPILNMEIWNDRFDYDATIEYNDQKYNVIHLANFLNEKKGKYIFYDFGFETREINAKRFLTQLNEIMISEFDIFLDFLFNLTTEKQAEFEKYCEKTNLEANGF